MPANINSIAWNGELPWHKQGTRVDHLMTSAEAIVLGGMNWRVDVAPIAPVKLVKGQQVTLPMSDRWFATVRSDTQQILGIVGSYYQPIQNQEAFSFFDSVVQQGLAMYEVVGCLGRGEVIWLLAKVPGELRIAGTDDISHKYLLLTTRHDGQMSLRMFYTPVRVVCQNTLTTALHSRESTDGIRIRHLSNMACHIEEAKKMLGMVNTRFEKLNDAFNLMNRISVDTQWVNSYVNQLFPSQSSKPQVGANLRNKREQVISMMDLPENSFPKIRGTVWSAYNAVTSWVDHARPIKKVEGRPGRRMEVLMLSTGAELKNQAFDLAMKMCQVDPRAALSIN